MSSLSFLITIALNSLSDHWLASISLSIPSEAFSSPFIWDLFLCLPIVCETLLVNLCFLNWYVLTPWVCGVNFSGRRPVRLSGAVSLISWTCCSWYAVYIGSLYVFGFWLLLGLSLVGPSLQLVNCGSLHPPHLVCCCAGADRLCQSWFFCLSEVLRLVYCYCSVVSSLLFLHHLVIIPDWSWVEIRVASTHSSTIFLYYLLVVPLLVVSLFWKMYWCSQLPPTLLCNQLEAEDKMD